jgi:hypothetical protein
MDKEEHDHGNNNKSAAGDNNNSIQSMINPYLTQVRISRKEWTGMKPE